MMLYECLNEGKTPPEAGRYATARVKVIFFDFSKFVIKSTKFIYGVTVSAEEEKQYNEELSFLIEPPKCTGKDKILTMSPYF